MSNELATLVSFAIYLAFFGWLGWRRGALRELIVFITAVVMWIVLQERGEGLVGITNLGASLIKMIVAGDLSSGSSLSGSFVTEETREPFLFVVWVGLLVLSYVVTNLAVKDKDSKRGGWALLLGMINGLFFAVAFLPSLSAMLAADGSPPEIGGEKGVLSVLGGGLELLWQAILSIWGVLEPLGSLALLLLLTALLVIVASTIKSGAKAKS